MELLGLGDGYGLGQTGLGLGINAGSFRGRGRWSGATCVVVQVARSVVTVTGVIKTRRQIGDTDTQRTARATSSSTRPTNQHSAVAVMMTLTPVHTPPCYDNHAALFSSNDRITYGTSPRQSKNSFVVSRTSLGLTSRRVDKPNRWSFRLSLTAGSGVGCPSIHPRARWTRHLFDSYRALNG